MKRLIVFLMLTITVLTPLLALDAEEITPENIAVLLTEAGIHAYVDEEDDVTVTDQYGINYWIVSYPEENRLWIQSGWTAADGVTTKDAAVLCNEANNVLIMLRCWYEPLLRTFYADYDLFYPEAGVDNELLIRIVEEFLIKADIYTDYLVGEGAI